ncbi:MAG: SseB family protein [Treponema sp.]|nr:SseB family protein [Treponema sp.]MBQ5431185.1 SseB family protein [Lachnospiraceae bacterium]
MKKVEETIQALQKKPSQEGLAIALTAIRRAVKAGEEVIVPVEPPLPGQQPKLRVLEQDGGRWLYVYTSFDQQAKSPDPLQSTFMGKLEQVLAMGSEPGLSGVILNPYGYTMRLDQALIRIIFGTSQTS